MVQIPMSTIEAIAFRRSQLPRVKKEFNEITRPGVYLLLGTNPEDPDSKIAYIGESEDVAARLQFHNSSDNNEGKLEFWTDTIALVSKDENLTKSHARYVEAILIKAAGENKRWKLINGQQPPEAGKLPKPDEAAMNEFIEQSKMLTGALGWDLFKPIAVHHAAIQDDSIQSTSTEIHDSPEFFFSGAGFSGKAFVSGTTGNWIIKENSIAKLKEAKTIPKVAKKYRNQLLTDGILIKKNESLVFSTDCSVTSPSTAASIVCGANKNGRKAWKLATNKTYADWEADQIAAANSSAEQNDLTNVSIASDESTLGI